MKNFFPLFGGPIITACIVNLTNEVGGGGGGGVGIGIGFGVGAKQFPISCVFKT